MTEEGKGLALALTPSSSVREVRERLADTERAKELIGRKGNPDIAAVQDVRGPLARAEKGGMMSLQELLRVAQILDVEEVKKSDKLLKLTVQVGDETRTVVSGIKPWYNKDKLLGRKVVLVANLKPAKLRGIESQGMILAADNGPDDVRVLMLDGDVESGSKVR